MTCSRVLGRSSRHLVQRYLAIVEGAEIYPLTQMAKYPVRIFFHMLDTDPSFQLEGDDMLPTQKYVADGYSAFICQT